jgi:hypothetical protein
MTKQWQSNVAFHRYYQQLKVTIESFSRMTPRTLHQYRPIAKFCVDPHFIYITARRDEHHEELQSYYKLTDENMDQITKEFLEEFILPVVDAELYNTDNIGSPIVTLFENIGQSSGTKKQDQV